MGIPDPLPLIPGGCYHEVAGTFVAGFLIGAIVGGGLIWFALRLQFRAVSAVALQQNNRVFLDLAQQTLARFQESH